MTEAYFQRQGGHPLDDRSCDFCGIISGRMERWVRYEDDALLAFKNMLTWAPVMFLLVPKTHMTQEQFWTSDLFPRATRLAIQIAKEDAPDGFRLVSNFGEQAAQTQKHGHLHILGGGELGLYMDFPRKGDYWFRRFGYTEYDPERQRQREEEAKLRRQQGEQQ